MNKMNQVIQSISENVAKIEKLNPNSKLEYIENYNTGKRLSYEKGLYQQMKLPKSNVIKFIFMDNSLIVIRPSGTEPKLKIYFQAVSDSMIKSKILLDCMEKGIKELLKNQ